MIHQLSVTNTNIYLDEIELKGVLKDFPNIHQIKGIGVYRISDVMFCNISGVLMVYIAQGKVQKMTFTSFNAIDIYDIPNTPREFITYKEKVLDYLSEKYRRRSDYEFFNRKYNFKVVTGDNDISILVGRRTI